MSSDDAQPPARGARPKYEREIANFIELTQDLALRRSEWRSRPYYLEYSTNSACNLRCIMCSQVENPPVVSTPLDKQEPFLREVFQYVSVLTPSATSEPLLNNMSRLLPLCEEEGVYLDIITNAMILTPELLEAMLPRLHRLTISIDSHIPEVFEKLRAPADFETVIANSRHAIPRCRELGIPVVVHMVLARECMDSLVEFVDFVADELGANRITVLEPLPNSPQFEDLDPFGVYGEEEVGRRLEAMRARCEDRGLGVLFEVHAPLGGQYDYGAPVTRAHSGTVLELLNAELAVNHAGFCPMVAHYMKVEPDGRAYPCCRAPEELELGNVFEEGVEEIWNGERMKDLRDRMFRGDYPEPCKGCVVLEGPRWRAEARAREQEG